MKLMAANWKMHKTVKEAIEFAKRLKKLKLKNDVLICAPATCLQALNKEFKGTKIKLGAENMHYEEQGAFTGEISAKMVKEFCDYVIIGHSERRHIFGECDESVNLKLKQALKYKLKPILCVGETLEEREKNLTKKIIKKQLTKGLKGIKEKIIIAYEPVWAIGTGKNATPQQAEEVHKFIKTLTKTKILYGGSVKPDNVKQLMQMPSIDGALVGGAALEVKSFEKIINY